MSKISIRFYNDKEVRAIWDEETGKWWFSAADVVSAINEENNYKKAQNYWYYVKNKDKNAQFLSNTKQLKMTADDGRRYYVEMNIAHPFMEGNGRSTRIWLDLILKKNLKKCVDWSQIEKNDYLNAMKASATDSHTIKKLIRGALTNKINDCEMFMKGIDYSYYYEQPE